MAKIVCVGCGKGIGNRNFRMDANGETGCPACFTEDGSGECWHRDLIDAVPQDDRALKGGEQCTAGSLDDGVPNHFDHSKRGFQP
jgi:hypothetical protein